MFVTSIREVLRPGAADFIQVLLNQPRGFSKSFRLKPVVRMKYNSRADPELRLALGVLDMDVRPSLFTREEVEPEAANAREIVKCCGSAA
jgi:hypothetical protein